MEEPSRRPSDGYGLIKFHTTCAPLLRGSGGAVLGPPPARSPAWQWRCRAASDERRAERSATSKQTSKQINAQREAYLFGSEPSDVIKIASLQREFGIALQALTSNHWENSNGRG